MNEFKIHMIMKSFKDFESALCWLNHSINDCVEFIEDSSLVPKIKEIQAPVKQMYLDVITLSETVVSTSYNDDISDKEKIFVFNTVLTASKKMAKENLEVFIKSMTEFSKTIETDLLAKKKLHVAAQRRSSRVKECLISYEEKIKDFTLNRNNIDFEAFESMAKAHVVEPLAKILPIKQRTLTLVK